MKKILIFGIITLLLMSSLAAAGFWEKVTGDATANTAVNAKPGFFARLVSWVKPAAEKTTAPRLVETPESVESIEPVTESSGYSLNIGQSISLCGRNIRLVEVGSSSATVNVEGTIEEIAIGGKTSFNGILISVDSVNYKSSAVLIFTCTGEGTAAPRLIETPESVESSEPVTVSGGVGSVIPTTSSGAGKCKYISNSELISIEGYHGKEAQEICSELEYASCLIGFMYNNFGYYGTADRTCSGSLQWTDLQYEPVPCDIRGSNEVHCVAAASEPYFGSRTQVKYLHSAICCK